MSWKLLGDIGFYALATSTVMFALLYSLFAPWWRTTTGRNIMAVMGSLAAALAYFAWVISKGGVPDGFYPLRALFFWAIAMSIAWRVGIFVKAQFFTEEGKDELEDAR